MVFPTAAALFLSTPIPQVQEHPNTDGIVEKFLNINPSVRAVTASAHVESAKGHTIAGAAQAVTGSAEVLVGEDANEATIAGAAQAVTGSAAVALSDLPPTGFRYLRINVTAGQNTSAGLTWRDVEFRISGVDQTGSGTASASSSQGSFTPANAFDGSFTSVWASDFSNTWPQWLKYDFGAGNEVLPDEVRIAPDTGLRAPKDFTVDGSNDNSSWTTLLTVTNSTGWTNASYRSFSI